MPVKKKDVKVANSSSKADSLHVTRVMLVLYLHLHVDREILRGVQQYSLEGQKGWNLIAVPSSSPSCETYREIVGWELEGVIGFAGRAELAAEVAKLPFPFVNSSAEQALPGMASVGLDGLGVGRMAAEYFVDQGFRNLVFCGNLAEEQARKRYEGFREFLSERGLDAHLVDSAGGGRPGMESPDHPIWKYLSNCPKPIAVFGSNDGRARSVHGICQYHGLGVPEEVAILGVDNDDITCQSVYPPLSSIRWPGRKVGYEAAKILDAMMQGAPGPGEPILFPPTEVVERHSTEIFAIDDPVVARAVRFIRENACKPICLADVTRHVHQTQQVLGVRFKKNLGRTISREIRRVRIKRINYLLLNTDMTLEGIARETGFEDYFALSHAYRRFTGTSPGAYRKKYR